MPQLSAANFSANRIARELARKLSAVPASTPEPTRGSPCPPASASCSSSIAPIIRAVEVPPIDPAGLPGPSPQGGRDNEEAIKAFIDLAGKEKAKIVVIPTAIASVGEAERRGGPEAVRELKPASVANSCTRATR